MDLVSKSSRLIGRDRGTRDLEGNRGRTIVAGRASIGFAEPQRLGAGGRWNFQWEEKMVRRIVMVSALVLGPHGREAQTGRS